MFIVLHSLDFFGDLSNYTFLETTEYKESKKSMFPFPQINLWWPYWISKNEYSEVILLVIIDKTINF